MIGAITICFKEALPSRSHRIGTCSFGNFGYSIIFRRSSVVVNPLGSTYSPSNAQMSADVNELSPGIGVVELALVAPKYSEHRLGQRFG